METSVEKTIAARILWAHADGCPIAPSSELEAAKMAAIVRRRWYSYERRNKHTPDTVENRIKDLVRGLADKEGGPSMIGPLIADYRWLCEQIAPILTDATEG